MKWFSDSNIFDNFLFIGILMIASMGKNETTFKTIASPP